MHRSVMIVGNRIVRKSGLPIRVIQPETAERTAWGLVSVMDDDNLNAPKQTPYDITKNPRLVRKWRQAVHRLRNFCSCGYLLDSPIFKK